MKYLTLSSLLLGLIVSGILCFTAFDRRPGEEAPSENAATYSTAEWLWLTDHPQDLVVASGPDVPPFLHQNQHGSRTGLLHDYLSILGRRLGCQFYHVTYSSQEELDALLREKKVALVLDLQKGHGRTDILEASVLATSPVGIYIQQNQRAPLPAYTLQNMQNLRTSISANSATLTYIRDHYPDIPVQVVADDLAALTQLAAGFTDCAIVNTRSADYYIREMNLSEIVRVGTAGPALQLLFGIRKDVSQLHSLIVNTLQTITEEQHEALAARRIPPPWWDTRNVRNGLLIVGCLFCILLSSLLVFYIWTRSLRYQVQLKSMQLQEELDLRKSMENQLLYSAKAEALGTLASGVYHDLNNFIAVISGYAELNCSHSEYTKIQYSKNSEKIYTAAQQAHAVLRKLLAYIRREEEHSPPLPVHTTIEHCLQFLHGLLPEKIVLQRNFLAASQSMSSVDNTQLMQLILNLCTNASDAMQGQGTITVTTRLTPVRTDAPASGTGWIVPCPEGECIAISVEDTGGGINTAELQKIFEPLYTTKPVGRGTGMGLAIVRDILRRVHSGLYVRTSPAGSIFTLYLPVLPVENSATPDSLPANFLEKREELTALAPPVLNAVSPQPQSAAVLDCDLLLIDSDTRRLRQWGNYYTQWGYRPVLLESIQAFRQLVDSIDLQRVRGLIVHAALVDGAGLAAADVAFARDPDLPCILCADEALPTMETSCTAVREVLTGPVTVRMLAQLVRYFR